MKKARGALVFRQTFFTLELMGVVSGHGNHIKQSREGETLAEEAKMK